MRDTFKGILTPNQLMALASIVQVGEAAYQELMEDHNAPIRTNFYRS